MKASDMIKQLQGLVDKHGDQDLVLRSQDCFGFSMVEQPYGAACACNYLEEDGSIIEECEFDKLFKNGDTDEPYQVNAFCID